MDPTPAVGAERILVVEDNALIRSSVVTMLKNLGYAAEEADTADMALALVDRGANFDLVFTDILLPGRLSGVVLASELRARDPATRILLTSGYAKPAHYQAEIESLGLEILVKPYRKALLSERIRATLDQKKE